MSARTPFSLCFVLVLMVACPAQEEALSPTPTEPPTSLDSPTPLSKCADAPVVTWSNFLEGFFIENCQTCHASTSLERYGAPVGVTFDTLEQVLALEDRILARATGDAPSMPPGGGVSDEDRLLLEISLTCWE